MSISPVQRSSPHLESKEEAKAMELEATSSFDAQTLCTAVGVMEMSAGEIAAMNPDILNQLIQYTRTELSEILTPHLIELDSNQQRHVRSTIHTLYSTSLMNSRFREKVSDLEARIEEYLPRTKQERFQTLIQRAEALLAEKPKQHIKDAEKQLKAFDHLSREINDQLMLFSYIDFGNQERIESLVSFAKRFDDSPIFPKCKKHFSRLHQNLQINQKSRLDLVEHQKELMQKANGLRKSIHSYHALSIPSILTPVREKLYDNHAQDFWQAGIQLMESALRATFQQRKKQRNFYLPNDFHGAVNIASKIEGFGHLSFNELIRRPIPELPERFIHEVWSHFSGPKSTLIDAAELMKFLLSQLPEETYKKLEADLKKPGQRKQLIYEVIREYLTGQIGDITFLSMKYLHNRAKSIG